MRLRALRALAVATAATGAAVLLFGWLAAPAPRRLAAGTPSGTVVAGAFHVHTSRSDGTGNVDEVAAAARRAGLQFVVFGDHGDGTQPLDPPAYRSGILCLDGVEISTVEGHYVALGLRPSEYPLGGAGRDVVEDVRRLGGYGIVAHPASARSQLRWHDWDTPFDGIEWLNADSEWRDESVATLFRSVLTYPFRSVETLASLLDRPEIELARWDALTRRRQVVGLAGVDAHARLSLLDADPGETRAAWFRMPAYEQIFRTLTIRVPLRHPLSGDAARDGALILDAIEEGRLYTVVDGLAPAPRFSFQATSGVQLAGMGELLPIDGPVRLAIDASLPSAGEIVLLQDGRAVAHQREAPLTYDAPAEPATYRAEVRLAGSPGSPPVPWIVSNPIYVGLAAEPPARPPRLRAVSSVSLISDEGHTLGWRLEYDPSSRAELSSVPSSEGRALEFRIALGNEPPGQQFAALVRQDFGGLARSDALTVTARADRPLRLSVQVRLQETKRFQRWQRSVYLDRETRTVTLFLDDLRPAGGTRGRAQWESAEALLFVVDTSNSRPGMRATIWVEDVSLGKARRSREK